MSMLTDGTTSADRKRKEELKVAIVALLDDLTAGGQTVKWSEVSRKLSESASVPVEPADFAESMRALEMDGVILISGDGARRSVRRLTGIV